MALMGLVEKRNSSGKVLKNGKACAAFCWLVMHRTRRRAAAAALQRACADEPFDRPRRAQDGSAALSVFARPSAAQPPLHLYTSRADMSDNMDEESQMRAARAEIMAVSDMFHR